MYKVPDYVLKYMTQIKNNPKGICVIRHHGKTRADQIIQQIKQELAKDVS